MIGLNMRLRNMAVIEFSFSAKRYGLHSFNTISHLVQLQFKDCVTLT